jgi:hypothetical protein
MQPDLHVNYFAILAAILIKAALGGLWYGPLFGRAWNRENGRSTSRACACASAEGTA